MNHNAVKNQEANGGWKETHEIERKRKLGSLRSIEADLKVIVGKEGEEREVFWHFRQAMALQSGYVDALLSTPLPTNNDSNSSDDYTEIVFSDITPSQWKAMMRYLDDPYFMTAEDAYELVPLYDRYDFKTGIKICDGAILQDTQFFNYKNVSLSVDKCVEIIVMSHEMNLRKTFYWGRVWLRHLFERQDRFPLKQDHLTQLVPTISSDSEFREFCSVLPADSYWDYKKVSVYLNGDGEELSLSLKRKMFDFFCHKYASQQLVNPLAPELPTLEKEIAHAKHFVLENLNSIGIKTGVEHGTLLADTTFGKHGLFDFHLRFDGNKWRFTKNIQWVLQKNGKTEFICKDSEYALLPPKKGWAALNADKKVTFTVVYHWRNDDR